MYEKTIYLGQLPNRTELTYEIGLPSTYYIVDAKITMINGATGTWFPMPFIRVDNSQLGASWYLANGYVYIRAGSGQDLSWQYAYLTVQYAKNNIIQNNN